MINVMFGNSQVPINTFKFPGGEVGVKLDTNFINGLSENTFKAGVVKIYAKRIQNSDDLISLFMITDAVKRVYTEIKAEKYTIPNPKITLSIGYMPYGRQDRVCDKGESFSLKVIADMINAQGYSVVKIFDPHSQVTPALINNSLVSPQHELLMSLIQSHIYPVYGDMIPIENFFFSEKTVILAPDEGAYKKADQVAQLTNPPKEVVRYFKMRELSTGKILGVDHIGSDDQISGKDFLIVDDICDGGRTFIEIAKDLKAKGAGKIGLYVSHGIFSKGFSVFTDIDYIWSFNPFIKQNNVG